jgi:hypothetical protein
MQLEAAVQQLYALPGVPAVMMQGGAVESIIFHRPQWTIEDVQRWISAHPKYQPIKAPHRTPNFWRVRLANPSQFRRLRTIPFGENTGIEAILGYP